MLFPHFPKQSFDFSWEICYTVHMSIWGKLQLNTKKIVLNLRYNFKKRRLKLKFPLYAKVKGVKNPSYQGALAQSKDGDKLQLVQVPSEEYPFDVFVYNVNLNRVLGFLDEELGQKLAKLWGKEFCRDGVIYRIVGGGNLKYFGCRILIFETMEMMKNVEDFSSLHGGR